MNTYCEANGIDYIDWNARLNRAHEASLGELQQWVDESRSWVTCACGNQCKDIPRGVGGEPFDKQLEYYGSLFMTNLEAIMTHALGGIAFDIDKKSLINEAKLTLLKIEARSEELLAEIGGENRRTGMSEALPKPGYAVFHGNGGFPQQQEAALKQFIIGQELRIAERIVRRHRTDLRFHDIGGLWNDVMFDYDADAIKDITTEAWRLDYE